MPITRHPFSGPTVYVAGHGGLVRSAIVAHLRSQGFTQGSVPPASDEGALRRPRKTSPTNAPSAGWEGDAGS